MGAVVEVEGFSSGTAADEVDWLCSEEYSDVADETVPDSAVGEEEYGGSDGEADELDATGSEDTSGNGVEGFSDISVCLDERFYKNTSSSQYKHS